MLREMIKCMMVVVGAVMNRPRGRIYGIRSNPMRVRTMCCRADTIRPYNGCRALYA